MVYSCVGSYAKTPYYIEKIGINIYSAEELCYYLFQNAFLLDQSIMNQELCDFVEKELCLTELAGKLSGLLRAGSSLSAFVSTILEDIHFCTREERKNIEQALRENEQLSQGQKRKVRGDYFCRNGKYLLAIKEYKEALEKEDSGEEFQSVIYHNMGVVYARMFFFEKAGEMMKKAYDLNPSDERYLNWLACNRLAGNREQYLDFVLREKADQEKCTELEALLLRIFSEESEEKDACRDRLENALSLKEEGKVALFYEEIDKILADWKQEYRKNMEE